MARHKGFTFRPRGNEQIELFRAGRLKGEIDLIYWRPFDLARHREALLSKEREEFLLYLLKRGSSRISVQSVAGMLLRAIRTLNLKTLREHSPKDVDDTIQKIWGKRARDDFKEPGFHSARSFRHWFIKFLRFHGKLKIRKPSLHPFAEELQLFAEYNHCRNLLPSSVESHGRKSRLFLEWYSLCRKELSKVSIRHIDKFMAAKKKAGLSSATLSSTAQALRVFIRYAHSQGWCPDIADGIKAPYHSRLGSTPAGRSWIEVVRLLEATTGTDLPSVRAKAALSLISTYALRCSEASRLLLSDFDWKNNALTIRRSKRGRKQRLPLQSEVSQAVLKYIKLRPRCPLRHLFVSLRPPHRPIGKGSFYCLTSRRLKNIGIDSGHLGPHSIRHARAMQLLRNGTTVKEIGDFLGQHHPESPLFYAKFDVELLREVADFPLEGLV